MTKLATEVWEHSAPIPSTWPPRFGDVVLVRRARPDDRAFIADSWIRSWAKANSRTLAAPIAGGFKLGTLVDRIRDACDLILVAHPEGYDDKIVGWVARLERDVLAYVLVRHLQRWQGVGTRLMAEAGFDVRGRPWSYLFKTPKMVAICGPSLLRQREPWRGELNGDRQAELHIPRC